MKFKKNDTSNKGNLSSILYLTLKLKKIFGSHPKNNTDILYVNYRHSK